MLKKFCSVVLLVTFLVNLSPICAQVTRRPAPKITAPVSQFNPDLAVEVKPIDSANDFVERGLPAPANFGGAANDVLAAALAREITDYEKDGLPILITTLQRAGFYIINKDRKILYQPTSGQGMGVAFYDFEVAGMYKLSRRGIVSSIEKFATVVGKDTPDLPPSRIAELMMRDLKTAANSSNKLGRFWARLIVELGKHSSEPFDLLNTDSPKVPLNIIQTSLWERRLIGDVIAAAQKNTATLQTVSRRNEVQFAKTSFLIDPPCEADVEAVVVDATALGVSTVSGQIIENISKGTRFEKFAGGLGFVNIALSWAKLVAAMTTLKGKITIADPMPLERTKNSETSKPENRRLMTAQVRAEVGNLEYLNCVRLAMNSSGLDFNVPSDGPLKDLDIAWDLIGKSSFSGQGSSKTGKYDNFVNLEVPDAERRKGANPDVTKQITDDNGESRINLVGAPKIPAVINLPVVPIRKKATVKVAVSLKSKRDGWQNALDIFGAGVGIGMGAKSGGAIGALLGVLSSLPEFAYRMKVDVQNLKVPVKDWEPCTSDWAGTVTYTRIFKQSYPVKTASRRGTQTIDERTEIEWSLNPRKRDMPANTPPIPDDVTVKVDNSNIFEGTGEADVCCDKKEAKDAGARIRESITLKVDNDTKSILKLDLTNGSFLLSMYPLITDPNAFRGTKRRSFTVAESACPVDEDQTAESETEATAESSLEYLRSTKTKRKLSPKGANGESVEEIEGTEKFDDPRGGEITYTWSLARCGD